MVSHDRDGGGGYACSCVRGMLVVARVEVA